LKVPPSSWIQFLVIDKLFVSLLLNTNRDDITKHTIFTSDLDNNLFIVMIRIHRRMKSMPGFTAELSLRGTENPYYVLKEHAYSDEVIPLQATRMGRVCIPKFSLECIRWEKVPVGEGTWTICVENGWVYRGMECG
jgi:hypothetical protein